MASNNTDTGLRGQKIAEKFLLSKGMKLIKANYRTPRGEVDLIMQDGEYTVFVEVKARRDLAYGFPREAVTKGKQNKIRYAANYYSMKKQPDTNFRFDVVEILAGQISHIENAF